MVCHSIFAGRLAICFVPCTVTKRFKALCYLTHMQHWHRAQQTPPSRTQRAIRQSAPWSRRAPGAQAKSAAVKPKPAPKPRTSAAYIHDGGSRRRSRGVAREATKRHLTFVSRQQLAQGLGLKPDKVTWPYIGPDQRHSQAFERPLKGAFKTL